MRKNRKGEFSMKKVWMSLLAILLVAVTAVTFVACSKDGGEEGGASGVNPKDPKKDVGVYEGGDGYPEINQLLTWEAVNAFPIVHDGMTIEEGRKLCVDFFRFCKKDALWMPNDTYEYKIKEANEKVESVEGSVPYAGLPYISLASGNIYRLMDYMDPETGVVDMEVIGLKPKLFGNQCSFGSYVGMGRVINSADYSWTKGMTPINGFIKVGDYDLMDVNTFTSGGYNTTQTMVDNGPDKMFEAYAGLKAGDVIVYFTTAGHVVVISGDAVVERDAKGNINPKTSYVTVIDQTPGHSQATNAAGDTFNYERNVDAKWDFQKLFDGKYVPYTFAEWQGTDPIESSKTTFSHTGETISLSQLYSSTVESNYGVMDIYASFYNKNGVEVYKMAVRAESTSLKSLKFKSVGGNLDTWGDVESLDPSKYEYTVKIYAQISTGERPTLWEGKLVK